MMLLQCGRNEGAPKTISLLHLVIAEIPCQYTFTEEKKENKALKFQIDTLDKYLTEELCRHFIPASSSRFYIRSTLHNLGRPTHYVGRAQLCRATAVTTKLYCTVWPNQTCAHETGHFSERTALPV